MRSPELPISRFIEGYNQSGTIRLHMPGHKGRALLGPEPLDITEIKGADYLFEAEGIIHQSEDLAAELYGAGRTLFSTEGSSLSIKGMLACVRAFLGKRTRIAAARNCHRAFLNGCILLGIEPVWIYPEKPSASICSAEVTPADIARLLKSDGGIGAVYITSPDYLGSMADIRRIAEICHAHNALLLVDNAHGAYLKFTGRPLHPLELGADLCCDSAHKTLPALTGASLLHISKSAPEEIISCGASEMSLFASTSPSYVIMQSIERSIYELRHGLGERIERCCGEVSSAKEKLISEGFELYGSEPMKLTVGAVSRGYTGEALAQALRVGGIEPEYADSACVVLMPTPYNAPGELMRTVEVLSGLPVLGRKLSFPKPEVIRPERALSPREAYFSPHRRVPVGEAEGRICARTAISCQPSIPIIVPGEVFSDKIIRILESYSIMAAEVVE